MNFQLEVVTLPVADVERSIAFYREQLGFALDVDYQPDDSFRVVQLTPPGSACSIQLAAAPPAAITRIARDLYLVVTDLDEAKRQLALRGAELGPVQHKEPYATWAGGWEPGLDPERRDYASVAELKDPDGHLWVVQERGFNTSRAGAARH